MIKTLLKNVAESMGSINLLLNAKLPVKASYAVSKLAKACQNEMEDFNKAREKIFKDGGCTIEKKKDEKGKETEEWVHPEGVEKRDELVKKAEELLDQEVEVNALYLNLEQFGNVDVPGSAFFGLDWAVKATEE